jgi:hypothetical protein
MKYRVYIIDHRVEEGAPKRRLEDTASCKDHLEFILAELHQILPFAGGDKWGRDWFEIDVEEVADNEAEA